ncbi:MAG: DoxX family protein [Pseudomonadota bacterium]|nr:MAG: DoxX family protein [Pseudomonadota bacterium]
MQKIGNLAGRILLAHIFLMAGLTKITGYAGTQQYMEAMGVPGGLLPLVILLEVGGAVALIVGWQQRWAALALAGFSVIAAGVFHANFGDQMQMIMFMKNLAIAGGLLILAGQDVRETISIDSRLKMRTAAAH